MERQTAVQLPLPLKVEGEQLTLPGFGDEDYGRMEEDKEAKETDKKENEGE